MLGQKDIEVLQNMMEAVLDRRLEETAKSVESTMERRLEETAKSIESTMERRLEESENLILEELERTRRILDDKIEQVQKNMDELNRYYRITKLEGDNTAILLKMIEGLSKRVEELERKTA